MTPRALAGMAVRWSPCALALVLASCQSVALPDLASQARHETPSAWGNRLPSGFRAAPADFRRWWRHLDDPALDALVQRALDQNLTLAQAAARVRQARLLRDHSGSAYLPSLAGSAGHAASADARTGYFQYGLETAWELDLFGRGEPERPIANADTGSAEAEAQGVRAGLVADVARNWAELCANREAIALQERVLALQGQRLKLLSQLHSLGLSSGSDLAQARTSRAQDEVALSSQRLEMAQAGQRLALLLGETAPEAAWFEGNGDMPRLGDDFTLDVLPVDLLRTRPDIALAEMDVLRAAGQLGLARAQLYPRLSLGAGYLLSTKVIGASLVSGSTHGSGFAGPVIDLPLFDWGRRQAQVQAQGQALDAAVLGYRQAVLTAVTETENALAALGHAGQTIRLMRVAAQAGDTQVKPRRPWQRWVCRRAWRVWSRSASAFRPNKACSMPNGPARWRSWICTRHWAARRCRSRRASLVRPPWPPWRGVDGRACTQDSDPAVAPVRAGGHGSGLLHRPAGRADGARVRHRPERGALRHRFGNVDLGRLPGYAECQPWSADRPRRGDGAARRSRCRRCCATGVGGRRLARPAR